MKEQKQYLPNFHALECMEINWAYCAPFTSFLSNHMWAHHIPVWGWWHKWGMSPDAMVLSQDRLFIVELKCPAIKKLGKLPPLSTLSKCSGKCMLLVQVLVGLGRQNQHGISFTHFDFKHSFHCVLGLKKVIGDYEVAGVVYAEWKETAFSIWLLFFLKQKVDGGDACIYLTKIGLHFIIWNYPRNWP